MKKENKKCCKDKEFVNINIDIYYIDGTKDEFKNINITTLEFENEFITFIDKGISIFLNPKHIKKIRQFDYKTEE